MNPHIADNREGKLTRIAADCGIVLLIILVIALPLYIRWSGSKLSYTPEPGISISETNSPVSTRGGQR